MNIPLENRAHVIVSYDPDFIKTLLGIPLGTEKVYYKQLSMRTPEWLRAEDVARELATAEDSEIVERLELTPVHVFTANIEDAMTYLLNEVNDELRSIQIPGNPKLVAEDTGQEWYPF